MPKSLLLVEDERILRVIETRLLEKHGYQVTAAPSAEQALECAQMNHFDLILMDIDLGEGMDGTECAQRILGRRNVPVVFLSAHTEPDIVARTEKITSYGYIVKNSGDTVLLAALKMAFRLFEANHRNKQQQLELLREKRLLQQYLDVSEILIISIDRDQVVNMINPKGCRILGYPESEIVGKNWFDNFIISDDIDKMKSFFDGIINGTHSGFEYFENEVICRDGAHRLIAWHNSLLTDEQGLVNGVFCSGVDITEQRRLVDRLDASEKTYRLMFEKAPLPYQSLNAEGEFIDVNEAWLNTLGYERDEVVGHRFAGFLHPDWHAVFSEAFSAFKKRGYVHNREFQIRHRNGMYRHIMFDGCIGYYPDGSFRQTFCVFREISGNPGLTI